MKIKKILLWKKQIRPEVQMWSILFYYPLASDLKDHKRDIWGTWDLYDMTGTDYTQQNGYITMWASSRIVTTATNITLPWNNQDYSFWFTARNMPTNYSESLHASAISIMDVWTSDSNPSKPKFYWAIGNGVSYAPVWNAMTYEAWYAEWSVAWVSFTWSDRVKLVFTYNATTGTRKWYKNWELIKQTTWTSGRDNRSANTWYLRIGYRYYQWYSTSNRMYRWDIKDIIFATKERDGNEVARYFSLS